MPKARDLDTSASARLAATMIQLRSLSGLTQKQVADRLNTTQAAIARLESGVQSPSVRTLQRVAFANGFCLEIGFVKSAPPEESKGCIFLVEDYASERAPSSA